MNLSGDGCPWLPAVDRLHDFTLTRRHGGERGHAFYLDALRFAQSQWLAGKPAQAILQIDRALMADLGPADDWREGGVDPYAAMAWMLERLRDGVQGFGGNPVRHFQHLASRMSGPRAELRSWRAWACLHLAERILPSGRFPRDGVQIAREGLWIPARGCVLTFLARHGWTAEAEVLEWHIG
ncbi:MAG TPA: hypothetical protein VFY13_08675 [Luteolibacter sp.]|nr:hypothetical protein [Luteolibacter sp.]